MQALNCAGASRRDLPPLPKKSFNSITCVGLKPGSCMSGKKKSKRRANRSGNTKEKFKYDPFTYDSAAMARDLLRGFIFNRKESLTTNERDYLEDLAEDGEENDLNKAMMVLSDDNLFFNPCQGAAVNTSGSTSSVNSAVYEDLSADLSSLNYSGNEDLLEIARKNSSSLNLTDHSTLQEYRDPLNSNKTEEDMEGNVEIIESGNGAIILQDLKVESHRSTSETLSKYESPQHSLNNSSFFTPSDSKRSKSVPHTMPAKLGTSTRQRRVAERKESAVHSNMWKAHKQGLSLTLNASTHSLADISRNSSRNSSRIKQRHFNGKVKRSFSPFVGGNQGTPNRNKLHDSRATQSSYQSTSFNTSRRSERSEDISSHNFLGLEKSLLDSTFLDAQELETNSILNDGKDSRASSSSTAASTWDRAGSALNYDANSCGFPSTSRLYSQDFFNSSQSSIPALDLALNDPFLPSTRSESRISSRRQHHSSRIVPSQKLETHRDSSVSSIPSLRQGQPMGDSSMTSILSLSRPHSVRQTSDVSLPSLVPSAGFLRESSITSTDSSVTLNSLNHSYVLTKPDSSIIIPDVINTSPRQRSKAPTTAPNSPESETSPRHKAPMRPSRNPSPLVRPKLEERSKSDGMLPPKQNRLSSSSPHLYKAWTKTQVKKRPVNGRVDVLDTIISQDSFIQKYSDDEQKVDKPVWSSPLMNESEDEDILSQPDLIDTIYENNILAPRGDEPIDTKFRAAESMREKFDSMRKYKSLWNSFASTNSSMDDSYLNTVRSWKEMRQSLSQDEISILREKMDANSSEQFESLLDDNDDDHSSNANDGSEFNVWKVLNDDFDGHDFAFTFSIFGTSADDIASTPHVLSPPLMESIYHFLPYSVSEQNYFMKYSLLRDGASFLTMLQKIRGSQHTILALETTEGEVFGSFTSAAWRKTKDYFGSGEAFLWKMKGDRKTLCKSVIDQAQLESDVEIFSWTGANYLTQLCNNEMVALGGGSTDGREGSFGLLIKEDLLHGYSSHSSTFGNPPLSVEGRSGASFEIVNLEVWTMTPCSNVEEAEKLEMSRLFLERHRVQDS